MYKDLKKLKQIKGLTDTVKEKIEKSWIWGLITDEEFRELMELEESDESSEEPKDEITI